MNRLTNKSLKRGWMPFSAFCNKYNIKRDGNEYRKLNKLSESHKENISHSSVPLWMINEEECIKSFNVKR